VKLIDVLRVELCDVLELEDFEFEDVVAEV